MPFVLLLWSASVLVCLYRSGAILPGRAGRGERIRTSDIQLPKLALYQAELHPGPVPTGNRRKIRGLFITKHPPGASLLTPAGSAFCRRGIAENGMPDPVAGDRKSTRLNSSH